MTRLTDQKLINDAFNECEHPELICPPLFLWPIRMPFHIIIYIGTDCRHQIELCLLILCLIKLTTFLRNTLTKIGIRRLNLEATLVHINHIRCVNICPSKRIVPLPKYLPFIEVSSPTCPLAGGRSCFPPQIKKMLCSDNFRGGERSDCWIQIL
jgi:hypothetical protein